MFQSGVSDVLIFCSQLLPHIEVSEMSISQSLECPLTVQDTVVLGGSLSSHNGKGAGSVSASLRHVLSHISWAEVSCHHRQLEHICA